MLPLPGNGVLSLSIGCVPMTLQGVDAPLFESAARRYGPFLSHDAAGLPVMMKAESGQISSSSEFTYSHENASLVLLREGAEFAGVRNEYALDSLIRILLTRLLLPQRGFLLHAATVIRDGRAYVFTGQSGAGKSTIAALSPAGTVLTDEISLVRAGAQGWEAHGTPFWGEFRAAGQNRSAPLAGIYALAHAPENRVEPLSVKDGLRALLPNVLFFAGNGAAADQLLAVMTEAICSVPVGRLWFRRDTTFWEVIPQ